MGNVYEVKGNVLDGGYGAVLHQANCQIQMGGGIAKEIKRRFPEAYDADRKFPYPKGKERLGKFSYAVVNHPYNGDDFIIVNVYGQEDWKGSGPLGDGVRTDYDSLEKGLRDSISYIKENYKGVKTFAVPRLIGCALAGGDWNRVSKTLYDISEELDIELYISEFTP